MTTGVVVWLALAAVFATLFFLIAAVVSVSGLGDLRRLLRRAERRRNKGETPPGDRPAN